MRFGTLVAVLCLFGCDGLEDPVDSDDISDDTSGDTGDTGDSDDTLGGAWDEFSENVTVYMDGDEVVVETNGLPDHTSPYWSPDHPLYVEATVAERLVPGFIDNFTGSYTLRVPASPQLAASSSGTTLGPIGIARSGSMLYNDREGGNQPIDDAAGGLDYTGAHTGPSSYHYHLETKAWSEDDDELIGVIADGFFLFGRKCASTDDHPDDLDDSGGHTSTTQYSDEASYHYHIINELYAGQYILLFAGDYQGTPNNIQ